MLRRTDRYLAAEILAPFGTALAFLFALLFAMQMLRGIEVMFGSAVGVLDVAKIAAYLAPHFLAMAMPVSFLFAVMLAVGRWSEEREVLALSASGIAAQRLWVAPALLALAVSAAGILLGSGPEPRGLALLKAHVNELIKRNMAGDVKPGVFYDALSDITLYAQGVAPESHRFFNVLLSDERYPDAPTVILARGGRVHARGGDANLQLVLNDGELHRSASSGQDYAVVTFQQATINVGVGGDLLRKNIFGLPKEELTPGELAEAADNAERQGSPREARNFRIALGKRYASPLAALAFAMCGVPLAMSRRRGSRALGAVATLAAYISYYVVSRMAEVQAEAGRLSPMLAPQLANVVFVVLAVILMRRALKAEA